MMKSCLTLVCLLWFGIVPAMATDLTAANRHFANGDFSQAAANYEKLLAEHGPDATIYYNLGNSYQQLKQYGPAILAYERAKLLTPRDPDLLANLSRARKAAAAFGESGMHPRFEAVITYLSRNVVGSALFLGVSALICGAVRVPTRGLRQTLFVSAFGAAVLCGTGATALYLRRAEASLAIVLTDTAAVRLSPFETAESIGTPGPGKQVRLGEKKGDFHYITIPGTQLSGWLADHEVAAIMPPP
jgi:tetratricopeptide (TPR) repeat protein